MGGRKRTPEKRPVWAKAFLAALAETGVVGAAAKMARVARSSVFELKKLDPLFAEEWDNAMEQAADLMEEEARRRAIDGVLEPVFGSGGTGVGTVKVGSIRRYSDTLLIFKLKGARPDKYRERRELVGGDGGPLKVEWVNDWRGGESGS